MGSRQFLPASQAQCPSHILTMPYFCHVIKIKVSEMKFLQKSAVKRASVHLCKNSAYIIIVISDI